MHIRALTHTRTQIIQPFDNLNVMNNAQYVQQSPIVQQPTTPQFNIPYQPFQQQQQQPIIGDASQAIVSGANKCRPQVVRGLQYKDSAYESRRQSTSQFPSSTGFTMDAFRLLSVLGRGHFGKVILSQYKKTGKFHRPVF